MDRCDDTERSISRLQIRGEFRRRKHETETLRSKHLNDVHLKIREVRVAHHQNIQLAQFRISIYSVHHVLTELFLNLLLTPSI